MARTKEETGGGTPSRPGIGSELNQMRANGAATADELREFLGSLKGKSPQEVLGVVAQSGLTRGIVQATVGCAILLVIFSVIPYGVAKMWPATAEAAKAETEDAAESTGAESETANTATSTQPAADEATPDSAENIADTLGIGETKSADPKSNPLDTDNKLDKLLDGVD